MQGAHWLSSELQYALVAAAVALSAWAVLRAQAPAFERRLRGALALPLLRAGRPAWVRRFGRWIAPRPKASAAACGGCDGCEPKS